MIFSTKSTYGLRAMINLAGRKSGESVSLAAIAKDEKISLKYLERLFSCLKKAGLVKSVKGASGGYKLAKSAKMINMHEIIMALEGSLSAFHCTSENAKIYCNKGCCCEVNKVLLKVELAINKALKNIKLSQLI